MSKVEDTRIFITIDLILTDISMAVWRNGIASDYDGDGRSGVIRRLQVRPLRRSLFFLFFIQQSYFCFVNVNDY